jgi:hypothetical protein
MTDEDHATKKGPLRTFQTAERGYAGDCQVGVALLMGPMFGHNERIYLPPSRVEITKAGPVLSA